MHKRMTAWLGAAVFLVSLLVAGCGNVSPAQHMQAGNGAVAGGVEVHFIDVGQGDAILIRTPHKAILLDCGDVQSDKREYPVVTYLKSHGIASLDALIISHPHADHLGGVRAVFDTFAVGRIYDSGQTTTTQLYKQYLQRIKQQGIPFTIARAGTEVDVDDGVKLQFLHPQQGLMKGTDADLNNNSIVVRLVYGDVSFLLAGDMEKEAEAVLLKQQKDVKSTILKVGHHGSSTSSSPAFLQAVDPVAAVIMCGVNNDYHHPHAGTLKKYEQRKIKLYRTDLQGSVVFTTDGKQFNVKVDK